MGARYDVIVVGAGPAGSTAAAELARAGARVAIFDPSHPREKPCGGGVSARARMLFPELEELVPLGKTGTQLRLVAPSGRRVVVESGAKTFAVDRTILDAVLLDRAVRAGATHHVHMVKSVERDADGWSVRAQTDARNSSFITHHSTFLFGADGVFSVVRRAVAAPIADEDLACGFHVLVDRLDPPGALIRFLGDRRGYAWVFNRKERSSVGVGVPRTARGDWLPRLRAFFTDNAPGRSMPPIRGWCLPQASHERFFDAPRSGPDWALVGDAAGFVDPMTGEGILYALWSGRLAARAVVDGRSDRYDADWRDAFAEHLRRHARWSPLMANRRAIETLILAGRLPFIGARLFSAMTSGGG